MHSNTALLKTAAASKACDSSMCRCIAV